MLSVNYVTRLGGGVYDFLRLLKSVTMRRGVKNMILCVTLFMDDPLNCCLLTYLRISIRFSIRSKTLSMNVFVREKYNSYCDE